MTEQNNRPTFLTVLCILTWVGSGFVLISQLISLATAKMTKQIAGIAEEGLDELTMQSSNELGGMFSSLMGKSIQALEHITELALVRIVGVLVVLFGSIMMWKLKKTGYYLFLMGKLIIIIGIFLIMGGSGAAFMFIAGPLLVAIAFSILYGVNLKALK